MERVAREPRRVEIVRREVRRDSAIRRHRALTIRAYEGHDDAVAALDRRPDDLDASRLEFRGHELARQVVAALRDGPRLGAERRRPGGDVRRLSTGGGLGRCQGVRSRGERLAETDDHVEKRIAEGYEQHDL